MLSMKINKELIRMENSVIFLSLSIIMTMSATGHLVILMPVGAQVADETTVSIVRDATNLDDQSYQPNPIDINLGDTILWTNEDSARHTVTELNSEDTENITNDENRNDKGIIESIVNEIITNIDYNLNNLIGNKENNVSPVMNDNSQSLSVSSDSADSVEAFDSGIMEIGDTFRYTFQESGTFEYYCTVHPNMVGEVVVSQ
jgi:plastocyanin